MYHLYSENFSAQLMSRRLLIVHHLHLNYKYTPPGGSSHLSKHLGLKAGLHVPTPESDVNFLKYPHALYHKLVIYQVK